jgi:hypothetical protein
MKSKPFAVIAFVLIASLCATAQSTPLKSLDAMKSLAGSWSGKNSMGNPVQVSYRVTAGGSALLSEVESSMKGQSEDMISMITLDNDRLLLTHYCTAGNQPRMAATASPDGKTITFDFVDATNLATPDAGHMHRVVFTFQGADHHTEDWLFVDHGKEISEHFDLQRKS